MKSKTISWILLALCVGLNGCASTKMHSFVDPAFRGRQYKSFVIAVQVDQLDQRDDAERIFIKKMSGPTAKCVRALEVVPPTRKYEDDELRDALKATGCDALIIVRTTQYYEDEYYVPQSTTTTTTGSLCANTYYYGNNATTYGTGNSTSRTYTHGGYTYKEPRIRHEVQLWDLKDMRMAWIGGTFTSGNRWAGFDDLVASLAVEVQETLSREGMIEQPAKEKKGA